MLSFPDIALPAPTSRAPGAGGFGPGSELVWTDTSYTWRVTAVVGVESVDDIAAPGVLAEIDGYRRDAPS